MKPSRGRKLTASRGQTSPTRRARLFRLTAKRKAPCGLPTPCGLPCRRHLNPPPLFFEFPPCQTHRFILCSHLPVIRTEKNQRPEHVFLSLLPLKPTEPSNLNESQTNRSTFSKLIHDNPQTTTRFIFPAMQKSGKTRLWIFCRPA